MAVAVATAVPASATATDAGGILIRVLIVCAEGRTATAKQKSNGFFHCEGKRRRRVAA